jgi:hypothetical protein
MTPQPLDPRKSPWKRGDVCTLGFEKVGFVLSYTPEYLEIRWEGGIIEKRLAPEIEDILRVAHADSFAPGDPPKTNLELLRTIEALERIGNAAANRTFKNDGEKNEAGNLLARSFATDGCDWDKRNSSQLLALAIQPETTGVIFKLRERFHRLFCSRFRAERCTRCSGTGEFRTSWGVDGICYACGGTGVRKQP